MAADLHIHVFEKDELSDLDFRHFFSNTMGSRWFAPVTCLRNEAREASRSKIIETTSVWVGGGSWLKAALFADEETFVPGPVMAVNELIGENHPTVDDTLIAAIVKALSLDNTTYYDVAAVDDVVSFLEDHRGKKAFTVNW